MKPFAGVVVSLLTSLLMVEVTAPNWALGQPIQAASDGTGTTIINNGDRFDIQDGTRSSDGSNLFHSFEQFGLSDGQIANFLSSPEIRNILGRVVGGEPSLIQGLIQVSGGNSNLYLMNPAGIVFGAGASLNVPASFTATTATGIGFDGNNWFNAFGNNNYLSLIGNPSLFAFDLSPAGSIVNEGNLAVEAGQSLTLLGGSVTNKGQVTTLGGNIIIAAVDGEKLVRISQPGQVLSLEIEPPRDSSGQILPVQPVDLPVMLTGNGGHVFNQGQILATNTNPGQIYLKARLVENRGEIAADGVNGGKIGIDTTHLVDAGTLRATGSLGQGGEITVSYTGRVMQTANALTTVTGQTQGGVIAFYGGTETALSTSGRLEATGEKGGTIHLLGETIQLLAAQLNASGNNAGGEILIGGNYQGQSLASPTSLLPNAQTTFVNPATTLNADALNQGNGGQVVIWADGRTQFYGNISARGGVAGGNGGLVEVSGKEVLNFQGLVDAGATLGQPGTLLLDPKTITVADTVTDSLVTFLPPDPTNAGEFGYSVAALGNNVLIGDVDDSTAGFGVGAVYLLDSTTGALLQVFLPPNPANAGSFGFSVTAVGNNLLVGDPNDYTAGTGSVNPDGVGAAYLFDSTTGLLLQSFFPPNPANADSFGGSVAAVGNNVLVGDVNDSTTINSFGFGAGAAYLFDSTTGLLLQSFFPPNPANAGDFGRSVAAVGNNVLIGVPGDSTAGIDDGNSSTGVGAAYLFDSTTGTLLQTFLPPEPAKANNFGWSVTAVGSNVLVGDIPINPADPLGGAAYLFDSTTGTLLQTFLPPDPAIATSFGASVAALGNNVLIGNYDDQTADPFGGAAYLFDSNTGTLLQTFVAPNPAFSDTFGWSVAAVGGNVLVGHINDPTAPGLDAQENGVGAAFLFRLAAPAPGLRFSDDPSQSITIDPNTITSITNTGTNVVMQANSDIIVDRPITTIANGNGGALILQAGRSILINGNITTDNGNLTLIANETLANGVVDAFRDPGLAQITLADGVTLNAGTRNINITLSTGAGLTNNSSGDITLGNLIAGNILVENNGPSGGNVNLNGSATTNGGAINLRSGGGINTTGELISNGGDINVTAANNINTSSIVAQSNTNGGKINLTSSGGNITTGILSTIGNENGGDITINATGNITTDDIYTSGINGNSGEIRLISGNDITTATLSTLGNGTGGDIVLNALSNITTNSILSSGGNGNGGMIRLDSGGSINLLDGSPTSQSGITSLSSNGNGGDITLNAATSINTGSLPLFSSSAINNGGNITLKTISGDITVAGINTEGGTNGAGGNVDITTSQFFRATGSFLNLNGQTASISTSGATLGGSIVIRHGGQGITPFIVGDAGTNGTVGAITTGNFFPIQTISPTAEFLNTHTQDGIQIISVPGQTLSPPPPSLPSARPSGSATNPQATLAKLVGDIVGAETSINQDPITGNSSFSWRIPGQGILDTGRINIQNLLSQGNLLDAVSQIDQALEEDLENYLGEKLPHETATVEGIRNVLTTIRSETKTQAVIIYALKTPQQLELVMVMPEGSPIHKSVPEANAAALEQTLAELSDTITKPQLPTAYQHSAKQLYQWFIAPIEPHLEKLGIDTLIFCMDAGLRSIPMAALYDGKQFLIEKYSLGTIPSVSLTNSRYNSVKNTQVLAMGASTFQTLPALPSVPLELNAITQQLGKGKAFLNEEFTLRNLQSQRQSFGIIHLATHADFQPGEIGNSYIQLWDSQLQINQLREMGWYQPPQVELLVLSACRTALGDLDMELGFGGLAVQAGVKSALASLWYVSDGGTLALMSEFYRQLGQPDVTIKAEALRRAQIAMLKGELRLEDGELRGVGSRGLIAVSTESELPANQGFTHPFYWAAFTMIGSPW